MSEGEHKPLDMLDAARVAPLKGQQKAVAVQYDSAEDVAPRITATGRGVVAEQIIALAFANGVRVREDADLVEILSALEVDSVIPLEAFAAVAEILSYVYQANATYGKPKSHNSSTPNDNSKMEV